MPTVRRSAPVIYLEGPDHSFSGADWWFELDYSYDTELGDLRAFTHMKFLGQKAQESASERYYSLVDNVQSKKKGSMRPKSVEKRCLFQIELLQEIVECANSVKDSLQTVDKAAAKDEAAAR